MPQGLNAAGLVAGSVARAGSGVKDEAAGSTERTPTVSGTRAVHKKELFLSGVFKMRILVSTLLDSSSSIRVQLAAVCKISDGNEAQKRRHGGRQEQDSLAIDHRSTACSVVLFFAFLARALSIPALPMIFSGGKAADEGAEEDAIFSILSHER